MTHHKPLPPVEVVREIYRYHPETGHWYRLKGRGRMIKEGSRRENHNRRAKRRRLYRYQKLCIEGVRYKAHRLAWLYMTGEDPGELEIDHWNGDITDNRFCNLRLATRPQNRQNRKRHKNSTTGHKGLRYDRRDKVWRARFVCNGVEYGKCSKDKLVALHWLIQTRAAVHGEFDRRA